MPFVEAVRCHPLDCAGGLRSTLLTHAMVTQCTQCTQGRSVVAGRPAWQACEGSAQSGQLRCWGDWSTSARSSRTFRSSTSRPESTGRSRVAFAYDQLSDVYICPAGKALASTGTLVNDGATLIYRAGKHDCDACELRARSCPKMPSRKVPRSIQDIGQRKQNSILRHDNTLAANCLDDGFEMLTVFSWCFTG